MIGRQSHKTATIASLSTSGSKVPAKVNSPWPNARLLIALHSPYALRETGQRMCPPEKSRDSAPVLRRSGPFSSVRFAEELSGKTGMFRVFR
jgi:hypothetical protein